MLKSTITVRSIGLLWLLTIGLLLLAACAPVAAPSATAPVADTGATDASAVEAEEDCPRPPDMDARFCDYDGDLVADPPRDPADWVEPDTLIFTYTPVEDPAVYREVWSEFIDHLSEVTGKDVEFFAIDSYAAMLEAMRAGRLHIAGFNTGSNPFAVNYAGFVPFAMMAGEDGSFGYEMEIIVPASSDVQSIEELSGRMIAFTEPTSNSGFKAPSALLKAEFDMEEGRDFSATFSGGHDNSILGVVNEDYEAAAVANSVLRRMIARDMLNEDDVRAIYVSQTFPTTGYGHVYNLNPELSEKIREAFFSFEWEGTRLQAEFAQSGEAQFLPITYEEYWAVVRQIDREMGVDYSQPQ
jgi:phosphonate transport system substrate-binding protein